MSDAMINRTNLIVVGEIRHSVSLRMGRRLEIGFWILDVCRVLSLLACQPEHTKTPYAGRWKELSQTRFAIRCPPDHRLRRGVT
jgi:hypothetical protein